MNPESRFNPEKQISSIDKIVARSPEEKKEAEEYFAENFSEQKSERVKEIKKSEEQIKIINFINDETNKLLESYGVEKFDVGPENIHILSKEDFKFFFSKPNEKRSGYGFYHPLSQTVVIDQSKIYPKTAFTHILFHELLHFKSHQIASATGENDNKYDLQQRGVGTFLNNGKDYFANLDEALIEELTIANQKNVINSHPDFKKDSDILDEYVEQKKKEGKDINKDEIMSVRKVITYSPDNKKEFIKFKRRKALYAREREIYNNLIDKIYAKNKDHFKNREEVFNIFAKSVFTGDIVGEKSWGRLIDKTFPRSDGSSTLKELAQKDANLEELKEFVDKL